MPSVPRSTLSLLLLGSLACAVDQTRDAELVRALRTSATGLDRAKLLPNDDDWRFDYRTHEYHTYAPGGVVNANAATFPATVGNGMTMAWVSLGPCAMLPPHYHPRAANYIVSVEGTTETFMLLENGARLVKTTLEVGQMTLFPMGSLHAMQNTGCGNATLISALSSEDAGTHNAANGLFDLPPEMLAAAFGDRMSEELSKLAKGIPGVGTGAADGSAACLKRCEALR
ncbi:spherulin-1A [Plectosphaerella cucumerina]|uniref:Spherulin-1A n=1 Tax=Plectosphaerella cucumerina TaxID=40658 RepID=A0A8K0TN92_9PEZI|nr:spherulin-1A [Plectosphaerella cucumerina]